MVYDVLELLMNYLQYLYLIVTIAPSVFPTLYSSPFWVVDIVMRTVFSNGSDSNANDHSRETLGVKSPAGREGGAHSMRLPPWVPTDLRLMFAFTNIVAPLVLVFFSTLLLGPLHCTAFAYLLCASVFWMVAGAMLLIFLLRQPLATDEVWQRRLTLAALMRSVSTQGATIITAVSAALLAVLLILGVVLRLVLGAREQARVLERLHQLECAPDTTEERVARRLLYSDDTGPGNGEEMEKEARVQRAKAEMAYQQLVWRRYKGTHAFSLSWTLIKLVVSLIGFAAAFMFAFAPKIEVLVMIHAGQVCYPLAAASFFLSLLFAVALVLGLTRKSRLQLFKLKLWLRRMLLCMVLLAVSFMYSPILRNAIDLFPCQTVVCAGADGGSHGGDIDSFSGSGAAYVQGTRLSTISRLSADASVPCNGVDSFLTASAILASSAYAIFFLLLHGFVTRQALRALRRYPLPESVANSSSLYSWKEEQRPDIGATFAGEDAAVAFSSTMPSASLFATDAGTGTAGATASQPTKTPKKVDVVYRARVASSENEAHFLYAPYTYAFRYFKLVVLAQKTATVVISTLMREGSGVGSPWMGFAACVLIHAGLGVMLVACRPYAQPLEFVVSLALQLMLSVVAAMGLTSALASTAAPVLLWGFVTSCLFLVPCAAVVGGSILTLRRRPKRTLWRTRDANRRSRPVECRFFIGWGQRLVGYVRRKETERWYEQCGRSCLTNEIFIPALYFVREKRMPVGGEPPFVQELAHAHTPTADADAKHAPWHWNPLGMLPRAPTNKCSQFVLKPQRYAAGGGRMNARRHWAILRTAVFAGCFCGFAKHHQRNTAKPSVASWRAVATPSRTTSFLPVRLTEEQLSHSFAMTTLLASVANESRWETSPYFSIERKLWPWQQQQQACRVLDEPFSSPNTSSSPQEARWREAFLERVRFFLARQRLLTMHCQQKRHLVLLQLAVDCLINAQVAQTMRYLLLFLGVTAAVAAALCVCGMLRVEGNRIPSSLKCTAMK
ncbi:hypothetical protein TraAM80_05854 [Trypanosoma rangeli]|uniref:Uncharacterized protein n=1 Tax=Trypanosoma rangeli TaxID=5698 RepID=A0A3R7KXG7_TRYRA|nr:uncharacterized protein TraAM80_05854 [Trypanosoma rangeli]RNF03291.1 hypothetical protein TraAM80_05854 [Trypanosoma rangeli]|eukprot:RNF03291.1 hypothetical protein TraAM80_05854 [Trypanosoma rangeli]